MTQPLRLHFQSQRRQSQTRSFRRELVQEIRDRMLRASDELMERKSELYSDSMMRMAEKTLLRAFELDPGNPATAVNLGEVLLRNGELERARFYAKRVNGQPEQVNAQSLWLQLRIERKLGNTSAVDDLSLQLRRKHPQSPETQQLDTGRFDD